MSKDKVKFILGRTATGKTYQILNEIKDKCGESPTGNPIFIITPEQMTFHTEYQLLRMNEGNSMIRANALSFNRLAHRIMQEVGGLSRYHLDEVGKAMLLQKIMLEKEDELGIFKSYIKKPNFIGKMDELFSEFKSHQIETADLKEKLKAADLSMQTKEKISTLASLYEEFNETTLKQYLTTEDYFTLLIETIEKSNLIKNADIYIDGYHTFNPQELAIIEKLAHHSRGLSIVLTADLESTSPLWQTTHKTYENLQEILAKFKPDITLISTGNTEISKSSGLIHLEKNFMQQGLTTTQHAGINIFLAPTRRQEIEEVAKRIHYLTHHQQVNYANIAIYSPHPTEDQRLFETIFAKYDIPYFLDYKETMLNHPVIHLLHKTFDIFASYWKHTTIFEVLKTGLFLKGEFMKESSYERFLLRHLEEIDRLENYVLARDIKKHHWISGATWQYGNPDDERKTDKQKEIQEQINTIKDQIVVPLINFELALEKAKTTTELATAVFEYLEELEIPMKLQMLAKTAEERENQKETKQHEQVWGKLLAILEQIVEVATGDEIEVENFIQIFKTGLEQLNYATIPATLDAVQIGDITRSRYQLAPNFKKPQKYGMQYVFIIGANDGSLPATPTESSLISEKERLILENLGIALAPSLIQTQQDEIFSLYTLMAGAQTALTLSCSTENSQHPSYLLTHLQGLFPESNVQILLEETKKHLSHGNSDDSYRENFGQRVRDLKEDDPTCDLNTIYDLFHAKKGQMNVQIIVEDDLYDRLTTPAVMFEQVFLNLRREKDQKTYFQPLLDYYQKENKVQHDKVKLALGYDNQTLALSEKLSLELYTSDIDASVSRIELFNKCEFAHFMNYGLKLKERDLFELTVANIGNLYHEALRYISEEMRNQNRSFASLSELEIKQLSSTSVEKAISSNREFEILNANLRMQAIKYKLTAVVIKTLEALVVQGQKSAFKESYFELKFKRQLDEVQDKFVRDWIQTVPRQIGNVNLSLRGVIDRVDIAQSEDRTYVRIVDYKSSSQDLEIDAVYHGLSLQLLTYLDVALDWVGKEARAAGALYFHLHSPYAKINEELLTDEESYQSMITEQHITNYRMTGYLPENYEVVAMSDNQLMEGIVTKSTVVPITYKKDQTFAQRGNKILKPEDFDILRQFTNRKIEEAVIHMTEGRLAINPTFHDGKSQCDWCKYQAICKFDVKNQPEKGRRLESMKPDIALEKIKETIAGEDEVTIHGN